MALHFEFLSFENISLLSLGISLSKRIIMKKLSFIPIAFIAILLLHSCLRDKPKQVPLTDKCQREQANNINSYLIQEAKKITDNSLNDMKSLSDWNKVRPQRYNEYIEMMGLKDLPLNRKRSDLNVKITGTIQKEGYRIEKLYYESLPGFMFAQTFMFLTKRRKKCLQFYMFAAMLKPKRFITRHNQGNLRNWASFA